MEVEQISLFLENKSGGVADVVDLLSRNHIEVRALSLADMADFGILRLIVPETERARRVLHDGGFTVRATQVVAVEIPGREGGLAEVLNALKRQAINVEYMYAYVERSGEHAIIIFRFNATDRAIENLTKSYAAQASIWKRGAAPPGDEGYEEGG